MVKFSISFGSENCICWLGGVPRRFVGRGRGVVCHGGVMAVWPPSESAMVAASGERQAGSG